MPYLAEFITVAIVHFLAIMSPGPDFAMITRNSLVYSKSTGIYSSIGLAIGILLHVSYSLIGIGFIISKSIVLFSIIKFLGAAYLIYIGYKSLKAKPNKINSEKLKESIDLKRNEAIKMGFLTNALNPKVTLFFLSLFTQIINPETPFIIQALCGIEMSFMTFVWFSFVATVLSYKTIKSKFSLFQHHFEKIFGVILIALGIKVAMSSSK
ncbi:MAG: LysE family transporter [Candidatus Pacebacteria bacterium]|nr:LysE family transporter [Candidatus Paceibacterota bacterium]